jgi:predicted RNA-binding protein with PIN domain
VFSETVTDISSARRNPNLGEMVDTLNELRKTPESLIERCVNEYSAKIENKSVVVIISDFLTDLDEIESAVSRLSGSDVILVNTFDEKELDPDMEGDKILRDPESDSRLRTYISRKTRNNYRENIQEHMDQIEEVADKYGAEYILASTSDDVFDSFLKVWRAINQ